MPMKMVGSTDAFRIARDGGYGGGYEGSSYEGASANAADTAHNGTTTQDARYDNYENVLTQLRHHQDDE